MKGAVAAAPRGAAALFLVAIPEVSGTARGMSGADDPRADPPPAR